MKVVMKPIKMIAWFSEDGVPTPIRFNIRQRDESSLTIKIDKITLRQKEKLAGNHMLVFTCQSIINNTEIIYEIKYELSTCRWFLYKI
ncbi:MAG: hypothetical protein GX461_07295 [Clostridiales bacterium]|jgi:hypothetical protein|nr:hypothetical protein [Clostridiales bacterium]